MNPEAGRWLLQRAGQDVGPATVQHTLGLLRMVRLAGLWRDDLLARHHDAACDAQLTRLVYMSLLQRAASSALERAS